MIGGTDIVFPVPGTAKVMDACVRVIVSRWPDARFENAVTGDRYERLGDVPLVCALLVYRNASAEAAWDNAVMYDVGEERNSMLYLIARSDDFTVVLDDPHTDEMRGILDEVRSKVMGKETP